MHIPLQVRELMLAQYRFYTCDVFTETWFGGNPLAVIPRAEGLSTVQMQQIAREFNFSETTFVLPAAQGHTRRLRIFTPVEEIPFAGHPNVGTAFTLAAMGELGELRKPMSVKFEEQAGIVLVEIRVVDGKVMNCELEAPRALTLGTEIAPAKVAKAISLDVGNIETARHLPQIASVGLPFLMVELKSRSALESAACHLPGFEQLEREGIRAHLHLYTRDGHGFDVRARMFAPTTGVPEDPATGSANCALAGLIAHYAPESDAEHTLHIAQGVEMGRPSQLTARTRKEAGQVTGVWIGGACVLVSDGTLYL